MSAAIRQDSFQSSWRSFRLGAVRKATHQNANLDQPLERWGRTILMISWQQSTVRTRRTRVRLRMTNVLLLRAILANAAETASSAYIVHSG